MQGIVGFFPTVNNMEMLKIAIFQRVSTYAHQGDLARLSRWRVGSLKREATVKARASAGDAAAVSPGSVQAPGARGRGRFKGRRGGGGGGAASVTERRRARHVGTRRRGHWPEARVQETGPRRHSRGLC